ncbi:DNA-damage-inducible protein J [Mobiluncus mulieris]|uniref:Addiction module antitoxin, RelB/DinJ family n=1 Tax=Mobiluncus mulieris TaxID=2052 RepID=A0A8G2M5T2_9ACTO|nr:type II toxin-antitoxin system RelB/DinJ family antitoxin [Mobiluncus mulieris]MBB5846724.1 DNA-damage-inducible protein J [Mobiluncus mulieris]STO16806.1 addiction module antitoxin, RelB/DinJ family [Mobiluncus mulieris]
MSTHTMEPISAKLRADEKATFLRICEDIGTSPSNALRMFVAAFNKRGGFPFDPANPYGFSPETLQAMADAEVGRVYGPFDTVEAMMESLNQD